MVLLNIILFVFLSIVIGAAVIRQFFASRWGECNCKRSLKGKTVIVTGANSGIGKATAKELVNRGARVILACRDLNSAAMAEQEIRNYTQNGQTVIKLLDLGSLASVRQFVDDVLKTERRLDILVNNAGVFCPPERLTEDGLEIHMGVNHLGHFLLTTLLIDKLKSCYPSRIIIVTSSLYKSGKIDFDNLIKKDGKKINRYKNSKLANAIFAVELSRRLRNTGVSVYAVSPGIVWTKLGQHVKTPWYKAILRIILLVPAVLILVRTPDQGCQTTVHCAISDDLAASGSYYSNCKQKKFHPCATDEAAGSALWAASEELVS